jgi:FKBP-type peptidyl-prolyl cis-trans isomerase
MPSPARCRGRSLFIVSLLATLGTLPQLRAQQPPASAPAAKSPGEKAPSARSAASYSLGVSMGEQLRASGVGADAVSGERLGQGVRDALSGKVTLTDVDRANISNLLHGARAAAGDVNHRAAAKFLAANGKKTDVITTASGLQYQVVTPGSGDSPKPSDQVTVNYRGTLLDGTEFDSSYNRGQPVTFGVSHVIPGWTEALQLMKPGGKYRLWVPPQLAYDLNPPPGAPIPAGSMLVFDVELIGIKPAPTPPGTVTPPAPPAPPAPK